MTDTLAALLEHLAATAPPLLAWRNGCLHLRLDCPSAPATGLELATPEQVVACAADPDLRLRSCTPCAYAAWPRHVAEARAATRTLGELRGPAGLAARYRLTPYWLDTAQDGEHGCCSTDLPAGAETDPILRRHAALLAAHLHARTTKRAAEHGAPTRLVALGAHQLADPGHATTLAALAVHHPYAATETAFLGYGVVAFHVPDHLADVVLSLPGTHDLPDRYLDPATWQIARQLLRAGVAVPAHLSHHDLEAAQLAALPDVLTSAHAATH